MSEGKRIAALVAIWLSYVGLYLNRRNISVAIPAIMDYMGLTHAEAGLLVTFFFIAYAATQIPSGWLADVKGGKRTLVLGNLLTSAAGYLSGLASSYHPLAVARLLCGIGQGAGWPSSSKLVSEYFPRERRGVAMGFLTSSTALGSFLALVVSGLILQSYGWRMVFMVPAVILLTLTALLVVLVKEPAVKNTTDREEGLWKGELFTKVLKDSGVQKTAVSYFFWKYSFEGLIYWLPTLLVETYTVDLGYAALLTGCITLTGLVSMPLGGYLSDKMGSRTKVAILSLTAMGVFMLALAMSADLATSLVILFAACFLMEMSESIYFTIPVDRLGLEAAGTSVGVINLIGQVGSLTAPWLIGVLVDLYHGYGYALMLLGISAFLGVIPLAILRPSGKTE
ncbi:MFS transporter [Candidatus Bathyarchaeota archaeon]|nr:MFS transporter [Candidatus Bathyarchaeota archaeon]RJS73800.1 MAG: MFS transporter [Candidatus Bathyarchaeota archaeon]